MTIQAIQRGIGIASDPSINVGNRLRTWGCQLPSELDKCKVSFLGCRFGRWLFHIFHLALSCIAGPSARTFGMLGTRAGGPGMVAALAVKGKGWDREKPTAVQSMEYFRMQASFTNVFFSFFLEVRPFLALYEEACSVSI